MNPEYKPLRKLTLIALLLALVVIILGAYTRLTDAGLGCPDWPGCYGHLTVPDDPMHVEQAELAFPERALEPEKAWNEMIHRYFAGSLGILIFIIAVMSVKQREHHRPLKLPMILLLVVTFQAALGMWTVTMKLMPIVVMAHLLGGFTTASLLMLLYLRLTPYRLPGGDRRIRSMFTAAVLGIVILVLQIALGGWTSANYAALACTQLPLCEGDWTSKLDFVNAFNPISPKAQNYEFGVLNYAQRMTIHMTHRFWAVVTFIYLLWFALKIHKNALSGFFKSVARAIILLLFVQVALGLANIWFILPLGVAVAHNAIAICLLLAMIVACYSIYRKA